MIKRIFFFCHCAACFLIPAKAQISLIQFSSGYSMPVDIKNCGDERLFIVEQQGKIRIADSAGILLPKPFLNIISRVQFAGEQGLLGLAFAPDFLSSGYFYVNYSEKNTGQTIISRFHVESLTPDSADPSSEEIVLKIFQPFTNHNGGHIAFGPDGYLYIGMGDGGSGGDPNNRAQNPDSLLGKMLRIEVNPSYPGYKIPSSNPFANDSTLGRGEIWSLGLRNPWRWSFDALSGDLWIGDVGQSLREEIDMEDAQSHGGLNYGWKCWEGNNQFSSVGGCQPFSSYAPPVYQYNHIMGGFCSITGGYVYRGARFSELYGKYFYADFCLSQIQYLEANDSGGFANSNLGLLGATNISTFGEDRHGELYCAGLNSGIIYRFMSADCKPVATINSGRDTIDDCGSGYVNLRVPAGDGYDYVWIFNNDTVSFLSGYTATQTGKYILHVANQTCTNSDSVYVNFSSPLNVTFTGLDTLYCIYNPSVTLVPDIPGGVFSGRGIFGNVFNPADAGTGTAVITYTYADPSGCSFSNSQSVRVDACLNVEEKFLSETITVYPNPSPGNFQIQVFATVEKKINLEVMDVFGRTIYKESIQISSGDNLFPINVGAAKGIYIIRFSDDQSMMSMKLIIQ